MKFIGVREKEFGYYGVLQLLIKFIVWFLPGLLAVVLLAFLSCLVGTNSVSGTAAAQEVFSTYSSATHLLISEIFYDTPGVDSQEEWIEIYNPTSSAVDISNYKLGDEETRNGTEGMYKFPEGVQVAAQGKIVIALNGEGFYILYGRYPDFEITEGNPIVPNLVKYTPWSTGNLALSNTGDEILLLDENDTPVDVVAFEAGSYEGVIAHPGVLAGYSLRRLPQDRDTDKCSQDLVSEGSPNPETGGLIDVMSPTVNILSPSDGEEVSTSVDILVTAEDNMGIDKVEFYIDDELVSTVSQIPYSYTWNTLSATDGIHTIKVVAKDYAGNISSQGSTVKVQRVPVAMIAPQSESTLAGVVTFKASVSQGLLSPRVYFLYRPKQSARWRVLGYAWSGGGNIFLKTVDVSIMSNGPCEVKAWLIYRNSWGYYTCRYSTPVTYVVDNPLSISTFVVHPNPYLLSTSRGARISYKISEKATISIKIYDSRGNLIRTIQNGVMRRSGWDYHAYWDGKDDYGNDVLEGNYTVKITAFDGVKSIEREAILEVVGSPITIILPVNGQILSGTVVFQANISSAISRPIVCFYYKSVTSLYWRYIGYIYPSRENTYLRTVDTATFLNGVYELRVVVLHRGRGSYYRRICSKTVTFAVNN